jgi:hypothetical protein
MKREVFKMNKYLIDLRLSVFVTEILNYHAEISFRYSSWFSSALWGVLVFAHSFIPIFFAVHFMVSVEK